MTDSISEVFVHLQGLCESQTVGAGTKVGVMQSDGRGPRLFSGLWPGQEYLR